MCQTSSIAPSPHQTRTQSHTQACTSQMQMPGLSASSLCVTMMVYNGGGKPSLQAGTSSPQMIKLPVGPGYLPPALTFSILLGGMKWELVIGKLAPLHLLSWF